MLKLELKLLKSKRLIIPAIALMLVMSLLAFLNYWIGVDTKQLENTQLARFLATNASQSTLVGLFFILWTTQIAVHLNVSGFYKMLLTFGWTRQKLFLYALWQLLFYSFIYMFFNYCVYSFVGLFFRINPFLLLVNTSVCALINQFLFFYVMGLLGLILGFYRSSNVMILPVLIYWMFEGWGSHFLHKRLEFEGVQFFPLKSLKLLVGENILGATQLTVVAVYSVLYIFLFSQIVEKRNFV
jgi:hypothetical protein